MACQPWAQPLLRLCLWGRMRPTQAGPDTCFPSVVSSVYPVIPCLGSLLGGAAGWNGSAEGMARAGGVGRGKQNHPGLGGGLLTETSTLPAAWLAS